MKKLFCILILFGNISAYNAMQVQLINHVQKSIKLADLETSKLTKDILLINGMSSNKVRHLLNNICSLPNSRYLEVGTWKGSTLISSLYKNNLKEAIAIDNWALFNGPKNIFLKNCAKFLPVNSFEFHEGDCFKIDLSQIIKNPINIYFYDGEHSFESQYLAFKYYNQYLDDNFIAIVDDYNWDRVKQGTQVAFKELNYKIVFEQYLPSKSNRDVSSWWNGIYIAVISKEL